MDITFVCDACEQSIAIDEAGAGSVIECPKCKARVLVPKQPQATTAPKRLESQTVTVEKILGPPLMIREPLRVEIIGVRVSWEDAWNATAKVVVCLAVFALIAWVVGEIVVAIMRGL
jgi:DNA-directed RNA polymerase subunit RPC12/RpoP